MAEAQGGFTQQLPSCVGCLSVSGSLSPEGPLWLFLERGPGLASHRCANSPAVLIHGFPFSCQGEMAAFLQTPYEHWGSTERRCPLLSAPHAPAQTPVLAPRQTSPPSSSSHCLIDVRRASQQARWLIASRRPTPKTPVKGINCKNKKVITHSE